MFMVKLSPGIHFGDGFTMREERTMLQMIASFLGPRPMIQLLGWRFIEEHRNVRYLDYPKGRSGLFVHVKGEALPIVKTTESQI
jgi:hypothetical protein